MESIIVYIVFLFMDSFHPYFVRVITSYITMTRPPKRKYDNIKPQTIFVLL